MKQNISADAKISVTLACTNKKWIKTKQICAIIFFSLGMFVDFRFLRDLFPNSEIIDIILHYGGGVLTMYVIAYSFLISLASNHYTRIAAYILLAFYPMRVFAFCFCEWSEILLGGFRMVNTNTRVWGIEYWRIISSIISFLQPYAYSIIARNNTFKKETNSWINLLILLVIIKYIDSPLGNYNYWIVWHCDMITLEMYNTILNISNYLINIFIVIAFAKLIFSSAFSNKKNLSPLKKDFYSPFNRYMAAAFIVLLLSWTTCIIYQSTIL